MLRISGSALAIIRYAFAMFCWITLPVTLSPTKANAQQDDSFGGIADLVLHRGIEGKIGVNISPELDSALGLQPHRGYGLGAYHDETQNLKKGGYPEAWYAFIWTWVEEGVMKVEMGAQKENKSSGSGYAFLTGVDGKLQKVARGKKQGGLWHWSSAEIDSDAQLLFDKTVRYWASPDTKKQIEDIPTKR